MFITQLLRPRVVGSLALLGVIGTAGFGFAGGNTMPAANLVKAGTGESTVSGYTVSAVEYVFDGNSSDPEISTVNFTLDSAADYVKVSLNDAGTMTDCTNAGSFNWTCNVSSSDITASEVSKLDVLASANASIAP